MRRHYSLFCISLLPEQLQKHMIANFLHVLSFFINIFIKIFPCDFYTHIFPLFFILISHFLKSFRKHKEKRVEKLQKSATIKKFSNQFSFERRSLKCN